MTVKLDITALRRQGVKLYPAMLYALATVVNRHEEFRTALNEAGEPGIYDRMMPCYTVFHRDSETFSNIWTEYDPDFPRFLHHYEQDPAILWLPARHGAQAPHPRQHLSRFHGALGFL